MTRPTDFDQLLNLLRAGDVAPDELARLARIWQPERDPPFLEFVAAPATVSVGTAEFHPFAANEATGSFAAPDAASVATPASEPSTPGGTTADFRPGQPAFPLPPAPLGGRYVPLRLHRSGGLGSVWITRDTIVGRDVALKTIRPDHRGGPTAEAEFIREAQLTGRLEHPCVVPVYDLPPTRPGAGPCYVMRFVAGRTLAEATSAYHKARAAGAADPLALAALLDAVVTVARAVGFAHGRGVLHSDLKGQNVVLGDHGEVFLLDWGLAVNEADVAVSAPGQPSGWEDLPEFARLTPPRSFAGTPGFIAPEVVVGGSPSRVADVYGLGGVLYQVLAGRPPYTGPNNDEILRQVKETDPRPVREVNPAVPPALAAVCHKALARDPAARYTSADDFATDVRRFLADEPVDAYREPWSARVSRWARRHRTGVIAAAAVLLATAVGSVVATALVWQEKERTTAEWHRAEGEKARAEGEQARAEGEKVRAEGNFALAWDLTAGLAEIVERMETGQDAARPGDAAKKALLDKTLAASERFLAGSPDDPVLQEQTARLFWFAGHLGRLLNDTAGADRAYREAVRLQSALATRFPDVPAYRARLADIHRNRAGFLLFMGKLPAAAESIGRAAAEMDALRAATPDDARYTRAAALCRIDRSAVASARGQYADAARDATTAAELLDGLPTGAGAHPLDPVFRVQSAQQLAWARRAAAGPAAGADLSAALTTHDEAVRQATAIPDPGRDALHARYRTLVERSRTALRVPDRRAAAAPDLDAAVAGWTELLKYHPGYPIYREGLGTARLIRGRLRTITGDKTGAATDLTAALALILDLGQRSQDVPRYRSLLGEVWEAKAELAAGAELDVCVDRALSSYRAARNREPDNPAHTEAIDRTTGRWPEAAARSAAARKAKGGPP